MADPVDVAQLQAGIVAEEELQLPARDTSKIEKNREKEEKDIEMGRAIREQAEADDAAARTEGRADSSTGTSTASVRSTSTSTRKDTP